MKTLIFARNLLSLLLVILVIPFIVPLFLRLAGMRPHPAPAAMYQPFIEWRDAWITPSLPAGEYMVILEYAKEDGGKLGVPLNMKLIDDTAGKVVPAARDWLYGENFHFGGWQCYEEVYFQAIERHRYRIEVDPEQVEQLAPYHHRLAVDLTPACRANWQVWRW